MPQISLYVDEETMADLRNSAERRGTSISKYVGNLIKHGPVREGYPEGYFSLYGCLSDEALDRPKDLMPDAVPPLFS